MNYIKVSFTFKDIEEYQKDLLMADLADIGFDSFEDTSVGFDAFITDDFYTEEQLSAVISNNDIQATYQVEEVISQNWNEEWEKNFSPLIITDECYVRATFHEPQPQYKYEIVVDPKMAFGTGHHQTTTMMMQYILETDFSGKDVLDMGAGTGILGILAAKRGAKHITAIDYDDVCYQSAIENAALNQVANLTSLCGSKEAIPQHTYDIILANINRNILLDQMEAYVSVLAKNGLIFFSGFYEETDLDMIRKEAEKQGLTYVDHKNLNNWVAAQFVKNN